MCGIREYRTGSSEQLITCAHQANVVSETSCRRHIGTGGGEQKQERRRQDKSKMGTVYISGNVRVRPTPVSSF